MIREHGLLLHICPNLENKVCTLHAAHKNACIVHIFGLRLGVIVVASVQLLQVILNSDKFKIMIIIIMVHKKLITTPIASVQNNGKMFSP